MVAHVRPTTSRRAGPPRPRAHVNTHLPTAGRRLGRQLVWRSRVARRSGSRGPLSLVLVAVLWLVAAGTGSLLRGPHNRLAQATLFEGAQSWRHPLSLLLSAFWAPGLAAYVWSTLALLTLGLFAERRLGTGRYAVALVGTQLVAAVVVAAGAWWVGHLYPYWVRDFMGLRYGGPAAGVVGAVFAATALLPTLWRRRIRVGGLALLATMVLFGGGGVALLLLTSATSGLVLGRWMSPPTTFTSPVGSIHEARTLGALVVGATAVGPLLAALNPTPSGPFAVLGYFIAPVRGVRPDVAAQLCAEASASVGCAVARLHVHPSVGVAVMSMLPAGLVVVAATGLRRGRRSAWVAALLLEGVLAAAVVGNYVGTLTDAGAVPPATTATDEQPLVLLTQLVVPCLVPLTVAIVVLVLGRGLFTVRTPRGASAGLIKHLGWLALGCAVTYVVAGLALNRQWSGGPTPWSLLVDLPMRLLPLELVLGVLPRHLPSGSGARALSEWVGVAFWLVASTIIVRSFRQPPQEQRIERTHAEAILRDHGGGSIAWMGMWDGNSYWFSSSNRSYVPYRVLHGVALTTGDLVGPAPERAAAVQQFVGYCESMGWVPCFYSVSAQLEALCASQGWGSVQIAQEPVLRLGSLEFTGKRFQDVRSALNAARREGVRTEWIDYRTASLSMVLEIRALSEEWVSRQVLPEMGFTLGGLDQLADPQVRCSVVLDQADRVDAVASWLPVHEGGEVTGWTLDFMRRRRDGFRHGMEILIAQAALDLQVEGFTTLSLSGAPLTRSPNPTGIGLALARIEGAQDPLERFLNLLGTRLEPVYGFRSLLRFKSKFQPDYRALYLLYPDALALPAIGRAITRAYVPDATFRTLVTVIKQLSRPGRTPASPRRSSMSKDASRVEDGVPRTPGPRQQVPARPVRRAGIR